MIIFDLISDIKDVYWRNEETLPAYTMCLETHIMGRWLKILQLQWNSFETHNKYSAGWT